MNKVARILIIDDETAVRDSLAALAETAGHQTLTAKDGREGLRRHDEWRPDLVVTDIVMPVGEGIETICNLRRVAPHLPIIAMSENDRQAGLNYLDMASKLGADVILTKPITPRALLAAFTALLPAAA
jgi:CheY-like chemotaxis protein